MAIDIPATIGPGESVVAAQVEVNLSNLLPLDEPLPSMREAEDHIINRHMGAWGRRGNDNTALALITLGLSSPIPMQ